MQGDGCWTTQKDILGWNIDSVAHTLSTLPPHHLAKLHSLLAGVLQAHSLSRKRWQQILGELRSMLPALPGIQGLFSLLQHALATTSTNRIRVTQAVKDFVLDFQHLAASLTSRPTRLRELVPSHLPMLGPPTPPRLTWAGSGS